MRKQVYLPALLPVAYENSVILFKAWRFIVHRRHSTAVNDKGVRIFHQVKEPFTLFFIGFMKVFRFNSQMFESNLVSAKLVWLVESSQLCSSLYNFY